MRRNLRVRQQRSCDSFTSLLVHYSINQKANAIANKLANLQSALDNTRVTSAAAQDARRRAPEPAAVPAPLLPGTRQANRLGKVNVAAWLHPDFKNSLRLVQARRPGSIQDLLEEALNDLFAKYDVPQVITGRE
jgi:hypothetical protein